MANYPSLAQLGNPRPAAPTGNSLAWDAQAQAKALIADQVAALRTQQAQAQADAAARANQIGRASLAAANFLQPLGNVTKQDYAAALAQNTGLAGGYSGQLRQDAASEAAKAQQTLAAIPGNNQQVVNRGDSLANLLYGLQGAIPGRALITEGLGATAAARALPAATLGQGQNAALGVLGAGRTAAARFDPQIAAAQAREPQLAHSILGDLISQQQKQLPKITASGGGIYSISPDGTIKTLKEPSSSTSLRYYQDGAGIWRVFDPTTGKVSTLPGAPKPASASSSGDFTLNPGDVRYDANGNVIASRPPTPAKPTKTIVGDSTSGRSTMTTYPDGRVTITPLPGKLGKPSASGGEGRLTRSQIASANESLGAELRQAKLGGGKDPKTGATLEPLTRDQAIIELQAAGWFAKPQYAKLAMKALDRWYPPNKAPNVTVKSTGPFGVSAVGG